jgi:uncharacterized protein
VRVVFDTNILVSAFTFPGGKADIALRRIIEGHDDLYMSRPILLELTRVLSQKFAHDREQISRIAVFLSETATFVIPRAQIRLLQDEPDNRILECAKSASADVIVTGDRAMLELREMDETKIVTLRRYLET